MSESDDALAAMEARRRELRKLSKSRLASIHMTNGGLMPHSTYVKWRREELVNAVLEDEGYLRHPGPEL